MKLTSKSVLTALSSQLTTLTPEVRKAAEYVLDHPNDVGVSSVREIADAAVVNPNSVVRMARSVGCEGYAQFRELFREQIRNNGISLHDRAKWLQSLSKGNQLSELHIDMVQSTLNNIETSFASIDTVQLNLAAESIVSARQVYVVGVGANYTLAQNFCYLVSMALDSIQTIPKLGSNALDDLAHADENDILVAITFKPYRTEVVETVETARSQGLKIVAISDSLASPIVAGSEHYFTVQTDTPQFFPSTVAALALLETLVAFIVSRAGSRAINKIKEMHERRKPLGIYHQ